MKINPRNVLLVLLTVLVLSFSAKAQTAKPDSAVCMEIVGIAMADKVPLDGVDVTLYRENEEMEMTEVTSISYHEHSFVFKLNKDSYYTIEVLKPGYVKRMIAISTKLPKGVMTDPIFRYEFEVELFKEQKNTDDYYLDFPVALIDYDVKKDAFVSHGKYTSYIKGKIKESMSQTTTEGNAKH
jgi:hypothetical protein